MKTLAQNVQLVHSNEKEIQAEHKTKSHPSPLSYPQWTRPEKWITKKGNIQRTPKQEIRARHMKYLRERLKLSSNARELKSVIYRFHGDRR